MRAVCLALLCAVAVPACRTRPSAGVVTAAGDPAPPLDVVVDEDAGIVRLRVLLPDLVDPGSVEVRLSGREVTVLAMRTDGRAVRSRPLRLATPVTEEGARADYASDGSVIVTLRKAASPRRSAARH